MWSSRSKYQRENTWFLLWTAPDSINWDFIKKSNKTNLTLSLVHSRNELVISLVFFCQCLLTGGWKTYCMVTLIGDATVFVTSIFYQYFLSLLILYIHFNLRSWLICLLIAMYQGAVLYVLYRVLVSALLSVWALLFFFYCVLAEFGFRLHCGYFIATI